MTNGFAGSTPPGRRRFIGQSLSVAAAAGLLGSGCTPRLNWRDVRHPEGLWTASFPAKPVSFSRTLALPVEDQAGMMRLTLWAAVIDEQRFTVGLATPEEVLSPPALHSLARGLEAAMLRNIGGAPTQKGASAPATTPQGLSAVGSLRLEANAAAVSAQLRMRTWVRPPHVIEAKVVGPTEGFDSEAADQFLSSVVILQARG